MIFNLQILRGLAALGVVFYHTDFRLAGDYHTDFAGVSIFFVISGFIMCFITRDDANGFLTKRAIRIVPMYWFCTVVLLLNAFRSGLFRLSAWIQYDLASAIPRSLLFLPSAKTPLLGVGWTLNFEVYFYLVFAAALLISRRFAPLIAAAFILAVIGLDANGFHDVFLISYYSHAYIHYFIFGIAVYYAWRFASPHMPRWPTAVVGASLIAFSYSSQFWQPWWPTWMPLYLSVLPIVVVASALFMERSGAAVKWKPLVLIGDASYAIYLTHTIFMDEFRKWTDVGAIPLPKNSVFSLVLVLSSAIIIGIAAHIFIEKPLVGWCRESIRMIKSRRPQIASVSTR